MDFSPPLLLSRSPAQLFPGFSLKPILLILLLLGCSVDTKPLAESAKLKASDGEASDYFGYSVATDGNHTVVGAYGDDDRGQNAGAAYVFSSLNKKWQEKGKLIPRQAHHNEQIGMAVAVDGDFIWVGSRGDIESGPQSGSAYVFRRLDEGWVQVGQFRSPPSSGDDKYGLSIAIDGEWAVVGAHGDAKRGRDAGCAYVYKLEDEIWRLSETIYAPDGKEADYFGFSVDISKNRMAIGAFGDDTKGNRAGAAYIYKRVQEEWKPEIKLTASDGGKHNLFGHSVAISEDRVLVGAHGNQSLGKFSGAAYLFARTARGWRLDQKLEAPDSRANKYFGFAVDLSSKRILIGARGDSPGRVLQAGSAYLFKRSGKQIGAPVKLVAQLPSELDFLGRTVAVADGVSFAGAHGDDDSGSLSGSVYTY